MAFGTALTDSMDRALGTVDFPGTMHKAATCFTRGRRE